MAPHMIFCRRSNSPLPVLRFRVHLQRCFRASALALILAAVTLSAQAHKFRVADPALAEALRLQGAQLAGDYGGFQILQSDHSTLTRPGDARVQLVDQFDFIQLKAKRLDTRAPELRALRRKAGPFAGRRLHLIQFAGPIQPQWPQTLERLGVRIVNYLPANAYLVYGDATALEQLQAWAASEPAVQWEGPYLQDYKLCPLPAALEKTTAPAASNETFSIQLIADDQANSTTLDLIQRRQLRPARKSSASCATETSSSISPRPRWKRLRRSQT